MRIVILSVFLLFNLAVLSNDSNFNSRKHSFVLSSGVYTPFAYGNDSYLWASYKIDLLERYQAKLGYRFNHKLGRFRIEYGLDFTYYFIRDFVKKTWTNRDTPTYITEITSKRQFSFIQLPILIKSGSSRIKYTYGIKLWVYLAGFTDEEVTKKTHYNLPSQPVPAFTTVESIVNKEYYFQANPIDIGLVYGVTWEISKRISLETLIYVGFLNNGLTSFNVYNAELTMGLAYKL